MKYDTPITDADLHAYLDGQLSDARRLQVENWLKSHPDKLRELEDYQNINDELSNLLEPVIHEPVPVALQIAPRRHIMRRIAAAISFITVGSLVGWQANTLYMADSNDQIHYHLTKPASFAHVVYTAEKKHPVEVDASQEQHLIKWLSKRLHTEIKAPSLVEHGYNLIGGRLLPSTDRMAAQFMYQNSKGKRVTLYVRRIKHTNADSMFQFTKSGEVKTFYWVAGELGYALSGELERSKLIGLVNVSYQQLVSH